MDFTFFNFNTDIVNKVRIQIGATGTLVVFSCVAYCVIDHVESPETGPTLDAERLAPFRYDLILVLYVDTVVRVREQVIGIVEQKFFEIVAALADAHRTSVWRIIVVERKEQCLVVARDFVLVRLA
jgi:hypothetical protein